MPSQNSDRQLELVIVTPQSRTDGIFCESVHLTLAKNAQGEPDGSIGIRPGHARAILALAEGTVEAFVNGHMVQRYLCSGGFARVLEDRVTVVTERAEEETLRG